MPRAEIDPRPSLADARLREPRPVTRIAQAMVAAFALACLVAGPAKSQPQPGLPTSEVPQGGDPEATAVEIAVVAQNGAVTCNPLEVRLPLQEQLRFQIENQTDADVVFAAPALFEQTRVSAEMGAQYDEASRLMTVPAGTAGQLVIAIREPGVFDYGCAAAGTTPTAQGRLEVIE